MLPFPCSQPCRTADASRPVAQMAASDASQQGNSLVSYFYGYWFSHWRA
jgi:hypothetical protein